MENSFNSYPICDTDIWVYLCLGDLVGRVLNKYKRLVVADVVEKEILQWKGKDPKYEFIANDFINYKAEDYILVINHKTDINEEDRGILENTLSELSFMYGLEDNPHEKNKGEFVSAIYADHFGIPLMQTNDGVFQEGGIGRRGFPDLDIQNWYHIVEEFSRNDNEKIQIRKKVEKAQQSMKERHGRIAEEESKKKMLQKLQNKFGKTQL